MDVVRKDINELSHSRLLLRIRRRKFTYFSTKSKFGTQVGIGVIRGGKKKATFKRKPIG